MKNWEILNKFKFDSGNFDAKKLQKILLENRGIKTKKEIDYFLNPSLESITAENLGINKKQLLGAVKRIKQAIKNKEMIVVYGDYDADGVNGAAILWESLNKLGAKVMPYIPHRIDEGYGLSKKGIDNLKAQYPEVKIIITVDNGIVANEAVDYAFSLKIEVIITDHHIAGKKLPNAVAIVHSTKICGAAVGWFLCEQLAQGPVSFHPRPTSSSAAQTAGARRGSPALATLHSEHLGLVAIATVTDVMRLTEYSRALLVHGLPFLRKTKRPGLISLFQLAGTVQEKIGVYEIGHIIGPRLNATGRLEHAMDSLRLLCTKDSGRARELAQKLNSINIDRQKITLDSVIHAKTFVNEKKLKNLLFISHESYEPGVIGLISGRLTEEFYRPSIVVSKGEKYSKASARSVAGFNIIEFIRESSHLLVDAGGHPGAAGFTVETSRIDKLQAYLEKLAEEKITKDLLVRRLRIDCEMDLDLVNDKLFNSIQKLSPFGYGNPEPTFLSKDVLIENIRVVGKDALHLKLKLKNQTSNISIDGILFNYDQSLSFAIGDKADVVYTISQNEWNGNKRLEVKIKDLRKN